MPRCADRLKARRALADKPAVKLTGLQASCGSIVDSHTSGALPEMVARKEERYETFIHKIAEIEVNQPVALRHLLDLQNARS
jgi:hypothetical protein